MAHGWPLAQLPATGRSATGWPAPSGQPSEVTDALSVDLDLDLVPLPWRSGSLDGKNSECPRLLPQLLHGAGPETWISPHGLAGLSGWVWWPPTPLPGRIPRIMRAPGPAQVPGRWRRERRRANLCVGLSTKHLLTAGRWSWPWSDLLTALHPGPGML